MSAKRPFNGCFFVLILGIVLAATVGCGKKPDSQESESAASSSDSSNSVQKNSPVALTFETVLARAAIEEKSFIALCRLLLTRSVLFATDAAVNSESGSTSSKKFLIKVVQSEKSEEPSAAMLFSSKAQLALAGKKFGWAANDEGMYSYAAMNGQAAFQVLKGNGYGRVILDAASPNAFTFTAAQIDLLAEGNTPSFYEPA